MVPSRESATLGDSVLQDIQRLRRSLGDDEGHAVADVLDRIDCAPADITLLFRGAS